MKTMDAKKTAFIAMMSALGITVSVISLNAAVFLSTVGQGGAALDLSHIATFVAAIFGGPYVGAIVGFLSGIYAGYYFGYVLGSIGLLSLISLPLGKAMTGFLAGFLYKRLGIGKGSGRSALAVPMTLISYIPECIFTILYFLYLTPLVVSFSMIPMIPGVVSKAWIEIAVMSLLMGALTGNVGFREFINRFFYVKKSVNPITGLSKES